FSVGEEIRPGSFRSHARPLRIVANMAMGDAVRAAWRRHGQLQRHLRVLSVGRLSWTSRNLFRIFRERARAAACGHAGNGLRQMETRNAEVAVHFAVAKRREVLQRAPRGNETGRRVVTERGLKPATTCLR